MKNRSYEVEYCYTSFIQYTYICGELEMGIKKFFSSSYFNLYLFYKFFNSIAILYNSLIQQ